MLYQAHRGVGTEYPENTMSAFRAAVEQGYALIELDPCFTLDGQCAILHDRTLNRTCRQTNGAPLEEPLEIEKITYAQALTYDAGVAMDARFRGTRIPLLSEALALGKATGVTIKLDNKMQRFSAAQLHALFDLVEASGAKTAFTCSQLDFAQKVLRRFPQAEIHYDGLVDAESLGALREMAPQNQLTAWLCLPSPETEWVRVPRADAARCALVKQYAQLGLWILSTPAQLETARKLGADVIETPGQLKPERDGRKTD